MIWGTIISGNIKWCTETNYGTKVAANQTLDAGAFISLSTPAWRFPIFFADVSNGLKLRRMTFYMIGQKARFLGHLLSCVVKPVISLYQIDDQNLGTVAFATCLTGRVCVFLEVKI